MTTERVGHGIKPSGDSWRSCHQRAPGRKWGWIQPNAIAAKPAAVAPGTPPRLADRKVESQFYERSPIWRPPAVGAGTPTTVGSLCAKRSIPDTPRGDGLEGVRNAFDPVGVGGVRRLNLRRTPR